MSASDIFRPLEYHFVCDALQYLIDSYDTDPRISPEQQAHWHREGRRPAIVHAMWGGDHPNRLVLLDFGGEPVGSVSSQTAKKYWDLGRWHVFPNLEDLIRTGIFFSRDHVEILLLALKGEWERHVARRSNWKTGHDQAFRSMFTSETIRYMHQGFNPDFGEIFELLEKYRDHYFSGEYTQRSFSAMGNEMVKQLLFYRPLGSAELQVFTRDQHEQANLLRGGSPDEQVEFWVLHRSWQEHLRMLDEVLMAVEGLRVRMAEIDRQWLCVFGSLEVSLREQCLRCEEYRERIRRKTVDMSLTRAQLDKAMRDRLEADSNELEELRNRVELAPLWAKPFCDGPLTSDEVLNNYRKACKSAVRRIFHLTFADRLQVHPSYQKLTERQKANLREAFDKARQARPEDIGWDDRDLRSGVRSLEGLKQVLRQVEHDLHYAGIDVDCQLSVQGSTLTERMQWLRNESVRVVQETGVARSELSALRQRTENEFTKKLAILADPKLHPDVRSDMQSQIDRYRSTAARLSENLEELFSGGQHV